MVSSLVLSCEEATLMSPVGRRNKIEAPAKA